MVVVVVEEREQEGMAGCDVPQETVAAEACDLVWTVVCVPLCSNWWSGRW